MAFEVGVIAPAVAEAAVEVEMEKVTERAGIKDLLNLAIPGLPPPVLVDHEAALCLLSDVGQFERVFPRGGEGLLANDVDLVLRCDFTESKIGIG